MEIANPGRDVHQLSSGANIHRRPGCHANHTPDHTDDAIAGLSRRGRARRQFLPLSEARSETGRAAFLRSCRDARMPRTRAPAHGHPGVHDDRAGDTIGHGDPRVLQMSVETRGAHRLRAGAGDWTSSHPCTSVGNSSGAKPGRNWNRPGCWGRPHQTSVHGKRAARRNEREKRLLRQRGHGQRHGRDRASDGLWRAADADRQPSPPPPHADDQLSIGSERGIGCVAGDMFKNVHPHHAAIRPRASPLPASCAPKPVRRPRSSASPPVGGGAELGRQWAAQRMLRMEDRIGSPHRGARRPISCCWRPRSMNMGARCTIRWRPSLFHARPF